MICILYSINNYLLTVTSPHIWRCLIISAQRNIPNNTSFLNKQVREYLSTSSHSRLLGSIKNIGLLQSNEFQKGKKLRAEYCNRHSIYPVKIILNGIENKMSLNGKTTYGHNLGHWSVATTIYAALFAATHYDQIVKFVQKACFCLL